MIHYIWVCVKLFASSMLTMDSVLKSVTQLSALCFMLVLFRKFLSLKVIIAVLLSWNSKLRNNIIYNSLQNSSMEVESIWERSRMPWPSFYMLSTTFTISKVESFFSGKGFRTEHCLQLHKYFQQNSTSKVPFCCKWMCQIQHTE